MSLIEPKQTELAFAKYYPTGSASKSTKIKAPAVAPACFRAALKGAEFRVQRLQEGPLSEYGGVLDTPEAIVNYLTPQLSRSLIYNSDCENFICVYLTVRRKPIGWQVLGSGTLDTLLIHARETFRCAILFNAAAIVIAHNHPSGDPTPSEADVKVTRDLIRAGQLLQIDLLDHVILGRATPERPRSWASLRELGYFYS